MSMHRSAILGLSIAICAGILATGLALSQTGGDRPHNRRWARTTNEAQAGTKEDANKQASTEVHEFTFTVPADGNGGAPGGEPERRRRKHAPLPPGAKPFQLSFYWPGINLPNGVPVGGWIRLKILSDGTWHFSGHLHDSGAVGYNTEVAVMFKAADGKAYTFSKKGSVAGTLSTSGSRDEDWKKSGKDKVFHDDFWSQIATPKSKCSAKIAVNFDWGALWDDLKKALAVVGTVVSICSA